MSKATKAPPRISTRLPGVPAAANPFEQTSGEFACASADGLLLENRGGSGFIS
jgi:hypothetical protein